MIRISEHGGNYKEKKTVLHEIINVDGKSFEDWLSEIVDMYPNEDLNKNEEFIYYMSLLYSFLPSLASPLTEYPELYDASGQVVYGMLDFFYFFIEGAAQSNTQMPFYEEDENGDWFPTEESYEFLPEVLRMLGYLITHGTGYYADYYDSYLNDGYGTFPDLYHNLLHAAARVFEDVKQNDRFYFDRYITDDLKQLIGEVFEIEGGSGNDSDNGSGGETPQVFHKYFSDVDKLVKVYEIYDNDEMLGFRFRNDLVFGAYDNMEGIGDMFFDIIPSQDISVGFAINITDRKEFGRTVADVYYYELKANEVNKIHIPYSVKNIFSYSSNTGEFLGHDFDYELLIYDEDWEPGNPAVPEGVTFKIKNGQLRFYGTGYLQYRYEVVS